MSNIPVYIYIYVFQYIPVDYDYLSSTFNFLTVYPQLTLEGQSSFSYQKYSFFVQILKYE